MTVARKEFGVLRLSVRFTVKITLRRPDPQSVDLSGGWPGCGGVNICYTGPGGSSAALRLTPTMSWRTTWKPLRRRIELVEGKGPAADRDVEGTGCAASW